MKKLLVLIPLLILSLQGFSQTDTSKVIAFAPDTGNVILSSRVAKLIIKDLIHYDGVKKELELTQFKVVKLNELVSQKDTAISILKQKDANNMLLISQKDEQLRLSRELTKKLQTEIKMQKIGKSFYKSAAIIGGLLATYILLIN
jgi:hypothetical protein